MSESQKIKSFARAVLVMVIGGLLIKWAMESRRAPVFVSARSEERLGEFGGDLEFLRSHYTAPQSEAESNHLVDLWSVGGLLKLVQQNGLTNNRALFVDSHGRSGFSWHGGRYGIYPHRDLLTAGQETPAYSAKDLATVLGEAAMNIHNIVLTGCNSEGRLRSQEFRKYFVNATNITYMAAGELAFKPMFFQALSRNSAEIQPLHGRIRTVSAHRTEAIISGAAAPGFSPLGSYVADLYLPGGRKPFRRQTAGRELLVPSPSSDRAAIESIQALQLSR
ncbi:MAG: hypothetical protein IPK15_11835 [Verrucomicrobia bacterium]|nr:hypothetical protein [Verrucomicrobiota bacterium]